MDDQTIKEARRLVAELISKGHAILLSGKVVAPEDEDLVRLFLTVASKKVEEKEEPPTVEGYHPKETYYAKARTPEGEAQMEEAPPHLRRTVD